MAVAFLKYASVPLGAIWWMLSAEPEIVRTGLDVAGLTTFAAGLFLVARYRATVELQDRTGDTLVRELEAQRDRGDRLEKQLAEKNTEWIQFSEEQRELRHQLKDQLAAAEARTDLTGLSRLILDNNKALSDQMSQLANLLAPNQPTDGGGS